jgi:hypothetical protein
MGVSCQPYASAAFYPHERTSSTHWIGGWVGLRASLDTEARGKILYLCRGSNPVRPVCSQTLRVYWNTPAPISKGNWRHDSMNKRLSTDESQSRPEHGAGMEPRSSNSKNGTCWHSFLPLQCLQMLCWLLCFSWSHSYMPTCNDISPPLSPTPAPHLLSIQCVLHLTTSKQYKQGWNNDSSHTVRAPIFLPVFVYWTRDTGEVKWSMSSCRSPRYLIDWLHLTLFSGAVVPTSFSDDP